ncbi:MAG: amidohydrolase [Armatimonadetes bacterium]|nr:amidohydrolase [Armatimonadota bacterium]
MIIDSHCHAGHADGLTNSYTTFEDICVSLSRMDDAGIDRAIVFPIATTKEADEETASIVKQYPDRLWGYAKVSQERDAGQVHARLRYAIQELGLVGLKLHGMLNRELMDACEDLNIPVIVDPGHKPWGLQWAAKAYPNVNVIIAHFGSFLSASEQAHQETIWMARKWPNIYLDTSGVMRFSWLEEAVRECGADKLIYGSDGPVVHTGMELAKIRLLKLPQDDLDKVLCKNIARIAHLQV